MTQLPKKKSTTHKRIVLPQWILKYIPAPKEVANNKYLRIFGGLIHNRNLWHLSRRSVANACSVGFFAMLIPVPFQMLIAAALAIMLNANLPIAIAFVWISNPITTPPIIYFCYKVGALIMHIPPQKFTIELSWEWLSTQLSLIWQPLLLGTFICAIGGALILNFTIRMVWLYLISKRWKARHQIDHNNK